MHANVYRTPPADRHPKTPGAGESGKSTVLKQMRLIHNKGFSLQERKQWKVTIFQNLIHAFQVVFGAMEEQEVDFAESANSVRHPRPIPHVQTLTPTPTLTHTHPSSPVSSPIN